MTRTLFALILFALPAQAQVLFPAVVPPSAVTIPTVDTTESNWNQEPTTLTVNTTVAGNYLLAFVVINRESGAGVCDGVTWNGSPMSFIDSLFVEAGTNDFVAYLYGKASPSQGTYDMTATKTAWKPTTLTAVSINNANITSPFRDTVVAGGVFIGTTMQSGDITSSTNDLPLSFFAVPGYTMSSPGAGQTQVHTYTANDPKDNIQKKAGAATVSMSLGKDYDETAHVVISVSLKPQ